MLGRKKERRKKERKKERIILAAWSKFRKKIFFRIEYKDHLINKKKFLKKR